MQIVFVIATLVKEMVSVESLKKTAYADLSAMEYAAAMVYVIPRKCASSVVPHEKFVAMACLTGMNCVKGRMIPAVAKAAYSAEQSFQLIRCVVMVELILARNATKPACLTRIVLPRFQTIEFAQMVAVYVQSLVQPVELVGYVALIRQL